MIITLCTDMGYRDHYVASIKASLIAQAPDARIVDISHNIPAFDIAQAAFVLKNVYQEFPTGSIHILGVKPEGDTETAHVIVEHKGHFFVGADNGIFSILIDGEPDAVFEITISQDSDLLTFPTKYVLAKAAAHLARGGTAEVIARRSELKKKSISLQPIIGADSIQGHLVHIDTYENIISNISRGMFKDVGRGRDFLISYGGYQVRKIHTAYNQVSLGEKVALFGGTGFLEFAINGGTTHSGGGATSLLGLRLSESVRIDFQRP